MTKSSGRWSKMRISSDGRTAPSGDMGWAASYPMFTIVLDDESWHTVYVYDKNVCAEANSLQSMNGGRQSEASDDKVRILALQGKGGSFSVLPCTAYNLMTGEKETCDQEQWQMVQDADIVRWEDCTFGRHGLGGFVSHVTIVLDDESWHTVYVYDKNVC